VCGIEKWNWGEVLRRELGTGIGETSWGGELEIGIGERS
jgi:hypothetical protein